MTNRTEYRVQKQLITYTNILNLTDVILEITVEKHYLGTGVVLF